MIILLTPLRDKKDKKTKDDDYPALERRQLKRFYRHPRVTGPLFPANPKPNIVSNNHKCPKKISGEKQIYCMKYIFVFLYKGRKFISVSGSKSQVHSFTAFTFSPGLYCLYSRPYSYSSKALSPYYSHMISRLVLCVLREWIL